MITEEPRSWLPAKITRQPPVTMDTLLGQVKLGMTACAVAANPFFMKRAMFGTIPLSRACSR